MKVIGTGLSGLVGSRVVELLSPAYSFRNLSLETGVDITDHAAVEKAIREDASAGWVFHFAAYTNVQGAEKDRALAEKSPAWKVNVEATEHIVSVCRGLGKPVLYIDTDYAFDGESRTPYAEDATVNPKGWYAVTKTEGAKRVLSYDRGLVIRISNPYRANPVGKTDFVHKMLERLAAGLPIKAPADQLFVPTFVDDLAYAVEKLAAEKASGIYHVVGASSVSPLDAARIVAATYGMDTKLISETTFAEYFKDRAPVPQYAVLSHAKADRLGITLHDFAGGMSEVRRQETGRAA